MIIKVAKHAGFCFGVKRAVSGALDLAKAGKTIYTLGDIIHNRHVVQKLEQSGVISVGEIEEIPKGSVVVIRSHGVAKSEIEKLKNLGIEYCDLTCPFVSRIHETVKKESKNFDITVIVGIESHPEVIGIKGWAGKNAYVVATPNQVKNLPEVKTALVVSQTTITKEMLYGVYEAVKEKIPEVKLFDSICETTNRRQAETENLAKNSDAVVVVGDKHSSNTAKLYEIAKKNCKNTQFIESESELLLENLKNCDIISLVAGASTPDWIIMEVETNMSELENIQGTPEETVVAETSVEGQEAEAQVTQVKAEAEVAEAKETEVQEVKAGESAEAPENNADTASADTADGDSDFLAELEKTFVKVKRGQFIRGIVVQVSDDEVCVNIGYKSDGIISKEDLTSEEQASPAEFFKPGDEIEAEIVTLNDGEGNVRLSRRKIENQMKWKRLVEEVDQDKVYSITVQKVIKGGVLAKLDGYDAFIPASQLSLKYVEDLTQFVGQELDVKVIDVDKRQKRFVLSHRDVLKERAEVEERELLANFERGQVIDGVVKRLTDFGAFVDVGGVDGLLHITDISWGRIKHPKDLLTENETIQVKIISVDPEKKKISLGYKQLQPKPWDLAPEKYIVGEAVDGKVVRIAPFGAFIELEPSIEKVEDVLAVGQMITAKVLEVNPDKKRISLSIRALLENDEPDMDEIEIEEVIPRQNREGRAPREGGRPPREPRNREENFNYVIPPMEEATTSLADLFSKLQTEDDAE